MKLLLDENLPHQLRHELPGHEVLTISYMGWSGIDNGELLRLASKEGFDALVTNDRGMEYEQPAGVLPVAVVVLLVKSNTIEAIRPLCAPLLRALPQLRAGQLLKIEPP